MKKKLKLTLLAIMLISQFSYANFPVPMADEYSHSCSKMVTKDVFELDPGSGKMVLKRSETQFLYNGTEISCTIAWWSICDQYGGCVNSNYGKD